jgi:uncharacterized membrane protein
MNISIFDPIYQLLEKLGYPHPIHPSETHIPIGLVVGAFFFIWTARIFRRPGMAQTARHCIMVAFLFIFPTVLFGIMDWFHYFAGAWVFAIKMKILLATVLFVLLLISIIMGRKNEPYSGKILVLYTLSFLTVVGVGFFGGNLVYSGRIPAATGEFKVGEGVFASHCSACHPGGGNIFDPNKPIIGSPKMNDFNTFLTFNRNPKAGGKSSEGMPSFPSSIFSDSDAKELYQYITNVLERREKK